MAADSRAHVAVAQAVQVGRLPEAASLPCADCGGRADRYHHHSYAPEDWLDVTALCASCHVRRHRPPSARRLALPEDALVSVSIRFKEELLDQVREVAEEENRSINGTVVEAVERYLRTRRPGHAAPARVLR